MPRRIRISPRAEADLKRIAASIRNRVSAASAERWSRLLRAAIADLAVSAETHPEADEAAALGLDLRSRLAGRRPHVYRILFTYTANEVRIHAVRHAAQDRLTADDL